MSDLTGHFEITQTAVTELGQSRTDSPIAIGIRSAGLPQATVSRDILDVLCLGHWADFGQSHHFMRRFDDQSPFGAYESALRWISSNALTASQQLSQRIASFFPDGIQGKRADRIRGHLVFHDIPWQPLGNAIHCLEDSFAIGHVVRSKSENQLQPGDIEHIKRYTGSEKKDHAKGDEEWWDNSKENFSTTGRQAIEGVKALLRIVLDTAIQNRNPQSLQGWQGFREQWLVASSKLSKATDHIFELIDKHYVGIRLGANNLITMSFDEEGLANDLLPEPTQTVLQVIQRMDDHFNTDADDVAELYVNKIRAAGGQKLEALKSNKDLIKILIKVMDEGFTSKGEQECIRFLKLL
ncbi:MAG: hypothetical protein SGI77_06665 [Pirellulaceae bacterium]|nr:hypothetical protein [Pirellulaceae bacterium]